MQTIIPLYVALSRRPCSLAWLCSELDPLVNQVDLTHMTDRGLKACASIAEYDTEEFKLQSSLDALRASLVGYSTNKTLVQPVMESIKDIKLLVNARIDLYSWVFQGQRTSLSTDMKLPPKVQFWSILEWIERPTWSSALQSSYECAATTATVIAHLKYDPIPKEIEDLRNRTSLWRDVIARHPIEIGPKPLHIFINPEVVAVNALVAGTLAKALVHNTTRTLAPRKNQPFLLKLALSYRSTVDTLVHMCIDNCDNQPHSFKMIHYILTNHWKVKKGVRLVNAKPSDYPSARTDLALPAAFLVEAASNSPALYYYSFMDVMLMLDKYAPTWAK